MFLAHSDMSFWGRCLPPFDNLLLLIGLTLLWTGCGSPENQVSSPDFRPGSEMESLHGTWVFQETEGETTLMQTRFTFRPDGSGEGYVSAFGQEKTDEFSSYEVAKASGLYLILMHFEEGGPARLLFEREDWNRATAVMTAQAEGPWPAEMDEEVIASTPGWDYPDPMTFELQ